MLEPHVLDHTSWHLIIVEVLLNPSCIAVAGSPKSTAVVDKGSMAHSRVVKGSLVNTKVKGSTMNNGGVNATVSFPKPSTLKEPAKQPDLNKVSI